MGKIMYKEYLIKLNWRNLFFALIACMFGFAIVYIINNSYDALKFIFLCSLILFSVIFTMIILFFCSMDKKIILEYKKDELTIQIYGKKIGKEYHKKFSINLHQVTQYEECRLPSRWGIYGNMIFNLKDGTTEKFLYYSEDARKEFREDIIKIIENYNFPKTLNF